MPNVLTTKLHFMDYYQFSSGGAATWDTEAFRLNGVQDPQAGAGGGSCTGFNQLAAIYGKYRVLGSKISVWFQNTCNTALIVSVAARGGVGAAPSSGVQIQQSAYEYPRNTRAREIRPYVAGDGVPTAKIAMYRTVRSIEGMRANTDVDYEAPVTTIPVNQCYWDVSMVSIDATQVNVTCNIRVRITYYVKFSEITVTHTD